MMLILLIVMLKFERILIYNVRVNERRRNSSNSRIRLNESSFEEKTRESRKPRFWVWLFGRFRAWGILRDEFPCLRRDLPPEESTDDVRPLKQALECHPFQGMVDRQALERTGICGSCCQQALMDCLAIKTSRWPSKDPPSSGFTWKRSFQYTRERAAAALLGSILHDRLVISASFIVDEMLTQE